jgi:predicted phosphodiesterase
MMWGWADLTKSQEELILQDLRKNGLSYDIFLEKYKMQKNDVKVYIENLRANGYNITERSIEGEVLYKLENFVTPKNAITLIKAKEDFSFGLISDTHLCSRTCHLEDLCAFYDLLEERGIKHVDHCGDLTDGLDVYKGQTVELEQHTLDEQVKFVVDNYPKKLNIETNFITGNHDLKVLTKVGIDVGNLIAKERPDMKYLGQVLARINLGGIIIELCHYKGSMAWSRGYRLQRYLRDYTGKAPDILAIGHKHTMEFCKVQNTFGFECGSFQGQNNFTKEMGLSGPIGGWIINIRQKDGVITKITPEWIEY